MAVVLTPKTTIGTLLSEYPFLLSYLASYHPEFKKLTNPIARRTLGRLATVERAAGMGAVSTEIFMADIADRIAAETGVRPEIAATATGNLDPLRQEELKAIIRELHAGRTPEEVKPRFEALIENVEPTEIAAMEQALIAEGLPDTEVKRLCDVHMAVFQETLAAIPAPRVPPGHPVDTFQRENRAVLEITQGLRASAGRAGTGAQPAAWEQEKAVLGALAESLAGYELHYVRKENQLFPFLEKHGVEGPTKVMWALHDDIRLSIKELREAIARNDVGAAVHGVDEAATMVDDMVNKEEKILFPVALEVLPEQEWREIRAGEGDVGYALVGEVPPWPAEGEPVKPGAPEGRPAASARGGLLALTTGALSLEQLDLLLGTLPLDVTFVDENDEVRFYSEGERVFPRSPGVIGRRVQNCHPPASMHKVQQILDAFRAGEKDVADFWIVHGGRFLHIRYFALRDAAGTYRGVLETVQDVTAIRALEGERNLIDW
jgi:DUF438 domain-containing protein